MENLTREQITAKAQGITEEIMQDLVMFTKETGCYIMAIDVQTDEKPIGATGLANIRQTVQAHFSIPKGHPAHPEEVAHATNH